jgi:glyoxylase-like metal-dependent hydrolase (beta-lactamase superfamily II)
MPNALPPLLEALRGLPGPTGDFAREIFAPFDWSGFETTLPNRTFDGRLDLDIGGVEVQLIELGPAHTAGDTIAYVPSAHTIFTGDLLFIGGTPIIWAGPLSNWVKACDVMLGLDADRIVPGHGPITDRDGIRQVRDYLTFVDGQARARFDAGMTAEEAMTDIALGEYGKWAEHGRIAQNVLAVYYELDPSLPHVDVLTVFGKIAELEGFTEDRASSH